ncbi:hypothetical protein [Silvimonas sp.]|uniref:hypothetical protein n=1 Tax=Silvimonas sp. TaxID=2650811 RepID=UPI00284C42A5|nr:hypothetical protein [Silvimonas sp.]MDR3427838.1 hypothetical protein [Silvimonas sp.]
MKYLTPTLAIGVVSLVASAILLGGCMTESSTSVTPASTNSVGQVTPPVTNTVTIINEQNLALDCAALQLVGTPALIYALTSDPSARPIVSDIQVALTGALDGVNTNVVSDVDGLVGNNAALQASILPLITAAGTLEQQLLVKYGTNNAVIVTKAVLQADLNTVNAALAAVPASTTK